MKLPVEQQYMLSVPPSQYHACWCSGDFRSQCISRHGIDPQSMNILSPASGELEYNFYTPAQWSWRGGGGGGRYWIHLVRPSVHLSVCESMDLLHHLEKGKEELSPLQYHIKSLQYHIKTLQEEFAKKSNMPWIWRIIYGHKLPYMKTRKKKQVCGAAFMAAEIKFSRAVLETKASLSVWDRQLLVRTSNFLHISLQIDVWISQNFAQDRQLFQLSLEHCSKDVRPSVCRRHGFRSIIQVCGHIGFLWFPESNFTLALNINSKLQ